MTSRISTLMTTLAIVACLLFAPLAVEAQQPEKVWRIGYLTPSKIVAPTFRQGLRKLGYVEGKNVTIEFRQGKRNSQYLALAEELVRLNVDLILAVGIAASSAAKKATRTIPIVMGNSSTDPVRFGLIDSMARPGGNVTGVIDLLPDLAAKRLEILKEIFPKLSRVGHLYPTTSISGPAHMKALETAAPALGVSVRALRVSAPGDLERAFRAAADGGAEALIVVGVSFFIPNRPKIVKLAAKHQLPAIYTHANWLPAGGLISYSTDSKERYHRATQYVDRIFKGTKPADLPVQQASKFILGINLKTAKALGITIPPGVLLRATKVIE